MQQQQPPDPKKENPKIKLLEQLGTLKLMQDITAAEKALEDALRADNEFRKNNVGHLASWGDDCQEVKHILAQLTLDPPPVGPDGKKAPTATQVEAWLKTQRKENKDLAAAISKQNQVSFTLENNKIAIEMARKRLDSLRGLLALRTAQVQFLVGG